MGKQKRSASDGQAREFNGDRTHYSGATLQARLGLHLEGDWHKLPNTYYMRLMTSLPKGAVGLVIFLASHTWEAGYDRFFSSRRTMQAWATDNKIDLFPTNTTDLRNYLELLQEYGMIELIQATYHVTEIKIKANFILLDGLSTEEEVKALLSFFVGVRSNGRKPAYIMCKKQQEQSKTRTEKRRLEGKSADLVSTALCESDSLVSTALCPSHSLVSTALLAKTPNYRASEKPKDSLKTILKTKGEKNANANRGEVIEFVKYLKANYSGYKIKANGIEYYFASNGLFKEYFSENVVSTQKAFSIFEALYKKKEQLFTYLQDETDRRAINA